MVHSWHGTHSEGRVPEGIFIFRQGLQINSNATDVWLNKGFALYIAKDYEGALAACDHVLELDPENLAAWQYKVSLLCGTSGGARRPSG